MQPSQCLIFLVLLFTIGNCSDKCLEIDHQFQNQETQYKWLKSEVIHFFENDSCFQEQIIKLKNQKEFWGKSVKQIKLQIQQNTFDKKQKEKQLLDDMKNVFADCNVSQKIKVKTGWKCFDEERLRGLAIDLILAKN